MTRHALLGAHAAREYRAAVLATNPVGYWRLGEASGTVAVDQMGVNNGTYVNAPTLGATGLLTGDSDTAVTFVAASHQWVGLSYVGLANHDFSLAIIMKPTANSLGANNANLFGSSPGGPDLALNAGLLTAAIATVLSDVGYNGSFVAGTTYHVVVIYVISTGALIYYVNGSPVRTTTLSGAWVGSAPLDFIGRYGSAANIRWWDGTLDEPAIWNRALSPTEVAALYAAGAGL